MGTQSNFLSDHWTTEDGLNFNLFKPALMDILQGAETPLTIGVYGMWGSGKTSLLRMLEKDINTAGNPAFRAVWFTAWKYDKQDALWRAFILRMLDALYPRENGQRLPLERITDPEQAEAVRHLDRLAASLYQTVTWKGEEYWSLDLSKTAKEVVKLPVWLALHLAKLGDAAKELGIKPELAEMIGREAQAHYMNQLASMEQFEQSFEEAIKRMLGPQGRLVIFIDDLDRCLPEKAVEILEAIKLFLNVPQTVFVLGMDRDIVRRGIESHYGVFRRAANGQESSKLPVDGDVYLQKLVQLPFNLPVLDLQGREKFIKGLEKQMAAIAQMDDVTKKVFARGLFPNPRQVKRALNVFHLLQKIALRRVDQTRVMDLNIAWPLLAKTVLIQSQWPELYSLWRQYPTLIQTLEGIFSRQMLTEQDLILGQIAEVAVDFAGETGHTTQPPQEDSEPGSQVPEGILSPYVLERNRYAPLVDLLTFPPRTGEGRLRARFNGLTRAQLQEYLVLAGTAEQEALQAEELALPAELTGELQSGDPVRLREVLSRIIEREADKAGPVHKGVRRILLQIAHNPALAPVTRAYVADSLDELDYLPDDLHDFVEIPESNGTGFQIGKYPVTNAQYQRFLEADDFTDRELWSAHPKFANRDQSMEQVWDHEGWAWLQNLLKDTAGQKVIYPREWFGDRFGIARKGVPVVALSWYEANAYCKWLQRHWDELEESENNPDLKPAVIRLPVESEWILAAGGNEPSDRFPWDARAAATTNSAEVLQRENAGESQIGRTTPVWMYPLGVSPTGVRDLGGNVWEWQANCRDLRECRPALRGGTWLFKYWFSRLSVNVNFMPGFRSYLIGFRVIAIEDPSADL